MHKTSYQLSVWVVAVAMNNPAKQQDLQLPKPTVFAFLRLHYDETNFAETKLAGESMNCREQTRCLQGVYPRAICQGLYLRTCYRNTRVSLLYLDNLLCTNSSLSSL